MKHAAKVTVHAIAFSFTLHVWHIVAGEHMVGAYADVAVDHVAHFAERAFIVEGRQ